MGAHNISSNAIVGEVLHGPQNYANWRACIAGYLSVRDLWYGVVVEGPSERAEILEPWWKRNVSALHAIHISCAPTMLSYIRDETTANDAWNTLAQKCEPPPPPAARQPVANVLDRPHALDFLKCINVGDLEAMKLHLRANPLLSKSSGPDFYPLFSAIRVGKLEIIDELLTYMSEEDVNVQDSYGYTALHYTAMTTGHTKTAERLIGKCKELLIIPDHRGYIPLISSCASGHKDMTHYLYNMTTPAYLLSPENRTIAASVVCCCIQNNLLDVALDLLRRCPELAVAGAFNDDWNAVQALSCEPSFFLSSCELLFRHRVIYSCLNVKLSEALSSEDDVRKETKNFTMQVTGKLLGLCSNLLKFFGIKRIYDLKLTHLYAHQLLLLMSMTIAGLDHEQIAQSFVIDAIISASRRGTTEFIVEIVKNNPDLLTVTDNCSNNILHLAGKLEPESQLRLKKISGAALQMQRKLQWFKAVEIIVPPTIKEAKNEESETPYEVFDRCHAKLAKEGERWMKEIAQSSTIVGTLIITIMFAALFTVPGGNNQETGIPIFLTKNLFKVFIISDAISLFASSTSVLISVGLLTSRYSKDDFLISLPSKLMVGLFTLFISLAAMMVAFCSTVFIMLKGQLEIVIPIVLLAAIPICVFVWLLFPLLNTVFMSTYGNGLFDRIMKKWL